ncbi:CD4-2 molecule, tandem duplicate 2 isoform X2 [Pseudorasbora parva]|uniref:CD4-2 molecule, tandem duplicate 2 isoform X2 n=1 Tax=Pseudorasbora parva TaxID=51549 RepID=UPI00351DCDC1
MPTCKVLFFLLALSCVKCDDVLYRQVGEEVIMKFEVAEDKDVQWKLNDILIININGKSGTRRKGASHIKDKAIINGGTLKLPRLETRDSGIYFCSQSPKRYILHVVSVFAKPGPVLLNSSNAELHCSITGDQNAEVTWLRPSNEQMNDKKQVLSLKSVTSKEEGQWTCVVKDDIKFTLTLTIVGIPSKTVVVSEGDTIDLPCSLPQSVSNRVVGGKWTADHLPSVSFPTLTNSESKGLHWNGENSSKVVFTRERLGISYNVTLMNAEPRDSGIYVCTVQFEDKVQLTGKTNLTVVSKPSEISPGERTLSNGGGKKPSGAGTWTKDWFGLQLWVWIAVGSGVLIVLTVVIVLTLLRNKQKKKRMKRLRSMRQPLTAEDYCKCKRDERGVEFEQREKPFPVPRQQRNPRTRAVGHDYIETNKAYDC